MKRILRRQCIEISREVLERTAKICGMSSAAAKALREASEHDGPVRFWKGGQWIFVEKLEAKP